MQLVEKLKAAGEDAEFYPSSDEIIERVASDIRTRESGGRDKKLSVLDIGAGDGRVLTKLSSLVDHEDWFRRISIESFAIEKSTVHIANMPKGVVVIGTDFREQTLVDKNVDIIFCNPPYSEFEDWACRIISESAAGILYLVIPDRWRNSKRIRVALETRGIEFDGTDGEDEEHDNYFVSAFVRSIGSFDFLDADRKARAKVELIRVSLRKDEGGAFDKAIEQLLPELKDFEIEVEDLRSDDSKKPCEVVEGNGSVIKTMVAAYEAELARMYETYRAVVKVEFSVLKELGVTKDSIMGGLKKKISGLKDRYWKALFEYLTDITQKLATKQRAEFLDSLNGKGVIDFTESNIYSMLIWIGKWASGHYETQLVELFKAMAQKASVERYKSNQKVLEEGNWRYLKKEASHYKLCYRMVLETHGGIYSGSYNWEAPNGLCKTTAGLLRDFITVANNLGFECDDSPDNYEWKSNKKIEFFLKSGEPLMDVRAFKNGNLHIRVSKDVMLAINVQAGKLLGWLRSADEAIDELDVDEDQRESVREAYDVSLRIDPSNDFPRLCA